MDLRLNLPDKVPPPIQRRVQLNLGFLLPRYEFPEQIVSFPQTREYGGPGRKEFRRSPLQLNLGLRN
ncbi:hypothetical protein LEP1GSC085_2304 [Leptospira interrogans str. L0996]|nr:hypothetical protein LEP1GSC085_2304 [Leptospira interrogans str. L0996]